ncbi:hypothetical protein ABVT39_018734 [Epinephelus coioides]
MEEIKKALKELAKKIDGMAENVDKISGLVEDVRKLNNLLALKDEKIAELEKRVDELEQYIRKEDVIISGLKTTHRTYSNVIRGESSGADLTEGENRRWRSRNGQMERTIILRFVNRKHKMELLKQVRKLKDTQVYVNEHLTKRNAEIAKHARALKKQKKIHSTWTRDCKIWIRTNASLGEEAKVLLIRDVKDLEKYETV